VSNKPDGGGAFPQHESDGFYGQPGMTLRQWYAGMAMQGLLAKGSPGTLSLNFTAKLAWAAADIMIEVENK
jgi:hypothetical protein